VAVTKKTRMVPIAAAAVIVPLMIAGFVGIRLFPDEILASVDAFLRAARGLGPVGCLLFGLGQVAVSVVGFLPASVIGVAAGMIYDVPLGFGISAISTMLGAIIAFGISRSVFRPAVARLLARRGRLKTFETMLARDGLRLVCLIRVSPVMPFAPTSYVLGLSSVSTRDYVLGTLASLPALLGYVAVGSIANSGLAIWRDGAGPLRWVLLAVGAIATVLLTIRIGGIARRVGLFAPAPAVDGLDAAPVEPRR
jgi:uncharacterized membrane protein YdjX (TVP38/TMEM64 family)